MHRATTKVQFAEALDHDFPAENIFRPEPIISALNQRIKRMNEVSGRQIRHYR